MRHHARPTHTSVSLRRRYEKAQKPLAAFEADIRRYADLTDEVLAESAHEPIKFLLVDCGPLKQVWMCAPLISCLARHMVE